MITSGSSLNELPGIWICRLTQIMRWVLPLLLTLPILLIHLVGRCLKSRRKVVIALIVLAFIVSGSAFFGWMYSEAESEHMREREEWIRHHCRNVGFWWNFSSASGFDLGYKGDERMLSLLRGETGSIELLIGAEERYTAYINSYAACELNLYGTLDLSGTKTVLPPGVRAEFTTPNVTLPAGGNMSVLYTITVDLDAPTGRYHCGVGISIANGTMGGAAFWLVIGPYTPHGNFSLVGYPEDFIARDEPGGRENIPLQSDCQIYVMP